MTPFTWILELVDKTSAPAKKAEESLGAFEKEMAKVEAQIHKISKNPIQFKGLQAARKELRELSGGSKSFAEKFEEMGQAVKKVGFVQNLALGVEAFHLAFEAGEKVVDVIAEIGAETIAAVGKQERFNISFHNLLGEGEGDEVLEYIEGIEKHTELSGAELKGLAADFITVGFSAKELGQVLPGVLDMGGFRGGGLANIQAAAAALDHIKTTGEISKRSLGSMGLEWTKVMAELRKETGLTDKQLKEKMDGGKYGDKVLHAVLKVTADKQGGKLGKTAEDIADTIDSKFKKLKELPEKYLERLDKSPALANAKKALNTILDGLDPKSANGARIFASLDRAFTGLTGKISAALTPENIDKFATGVEDVIDGLSKLPPILDKVVTVAEVLGVVWAGSTIVGTITTLTAALPVLATGLGVIGAPVLAVGAAFVAVAVAVERITAAIKELGGAKAVLNDLKDFVVSGGMPSAAAMNQGGGANRSGYEAMQAENARNVALAHARGNVAAEQPEMRNLQRDETPAVPSQASRVKPGGGGKIVMGPVTVHIEAHGVDADEIAAKVGSTLPGAVQQAHERAAVARGVM